MKKLNGNIAFYSQIKTLVKVLEQSMSKVSIVYGLFLVRNAVNLHKCACPLNSLLNRKTVVFIHKIECNQS